MGLAIHCRVRRGRKYYRLWGSINDCYLTPPTDLEGVIDNMIMHRIRSEVADTILCQEQYLRDAEARDAAERGGLARPWEKQRSKPKPQGAGTDYGKFLVKIAMETEGREVKIFIVTLRMKKFPHLPRSQRLRR